MLCIGFNTIRALNLKYMLHNQLSFFIELKDHSDHINLRRNSTLQPPIGILVNREP